MSLTTISPFSAHSDAKVQPVRLLGLCRRDTYGIGAAVPSKADSPRDNTTPYRSFYHEVEAKHAVTQNQQAGKDNNSIIGDVSCRLQRYTDILVTMLLTCTSYM